MENRRPLNSAPTGPLRIEERRARFCANVEVRAVVGWGVSARGPGFGHSILWSQGSGAGMLLPRRATTRASGPSGGLPFPAGRGSNAIPVSLMPKQPDGTPGRKPLRDRALRPPSVMQLILRALHS